MHRLKHETKEQQMSSGKAKRQHKIKKASNVFKGSNAAGRRKHRRLMERLKAAK